MGRKFQPQIIEPALVNGQQAAWAVGPYILQLTNGNQEYRRLIDGRALIWEENGVTYRLESCLKPVEAIKIAESLEPIP